MKPERQLPSHELIMSELMMPYTANFSGNVHGGSTKWHIPAPAVTAVPIALLCLLIKYCLKSLFMLVSW